MKPLTYVEARQMKTAGPFSFVDTFSTRVTRLKVCGNDVLTPASCVEPDAPDALLVWSAFSPLEAAA